MANIDAKVVWHPPDIVETIFLPSSGNNPTIREIRCNVPMDDLEVGEYITDFVCVKMDGDWMVRECVCRKHLTKPMTIKLLDASREYWLRHGVMD